MYKLYYISIDVFTKFILFQHKATIIGYSERIELITVVIIYETDVLTITSEDSNWVY